MAMADRDDEWWTLSEVCAFLKVHRATIHRWRRSRSVAFPAGAMFAKGVLRFRAAAVRKWAAGIEAQEASIADQSGIGAENVQSNARSTGSAGPGAVTSETACADAPPVARAQRPDAGQTPISLKPKRRSRSRRSREGDAAQLILL
jgi:hypothetical protein